MQDNEVLGWIKTEPKGKRWKCNVFEHDPGFGKSPVYMDTGKTIAEVWHKKFTSRSSQWRYRVYTGDGHHGYEYSCSEAISRALFLSRLVKEV